MTKINIIRGQLIHGFNGETDVLSVLGEDFYTKIFAEEFQSAIGYEPRQVQVRYSLSTKPIPPELVSIEFAYYQIGRATAEYGMAYSDITGYLWTDEIATVGGHNLIAELSDSIGKFLHMEIEY